MLLLWHRHCLRRTRCKLSLCAVHPHTRRVVFDHALRPGKRHARRIFPRSNADDRVGRTHMARIESVPGSAARTCEIGLKHRMKILRREAVGVGACVAERAAKRNAQMREVPADAGLCLKTSAAVVLGPVLPAL